MDTDIIACQIERLKDAEAPVSQDMLCTTRDMLDNAKCILKQLEEQWDARAEEWLQNNPPFVVGTTEYRLVKAERKVKCNDFGAAMMALMEVTGGDADLFAACLSTGAFKEAATRDAFEGAGKIEVYKQHFAVTFKDRLGRTGVKGAVEKRDTRFAVARGK